MTNPQAYLSWQIPPLPKEDPPPKQAIEELIEWHEQRGDRTSYYAEVIPGSDEDGTESVANLVIITTGSPHQMATVKAILRSVL